MPIKIYSSVKINTTINQKEYSEQNILSIKAWVGSVSMIFEENILLEWGGPFLDLIYAHKDL
jgi:hypothetical protein